MKTTTLHAALAFKIANAAFASFGKRTVSKAVAAKAHSRKAKATLDAKATVSVIAVTLLSLTAGCVSVSTTGALLPDNPKPAASTNKKFVLKDVSRVRTIEFETQSGGRGSSTKSYDSWPEFSSAFRELELSDSTASTEIPFDVVIRERYSVNTGAHSWTIAPWIVTLGLFPAINTDENECIVQIGLPESAKIDFSGKIIRDEWGCWFTLPWAFFPDDEEKSTAEILAKAVRANLTSERYEAALATARDKREEENRLAELERQKMAEQRKAEAKAREEEAELERQKELAAKMAEKERRKTEAKARAEAEAKVRETQQAN